MFRLSASPENGRTILEAKPAIPKNRVNKNRTVNRLTRSGQPGTTPGEGLQPATRAT